MVFTEAGVRLMQSVRLIQVSLYFILMITNLALPSADDTLRAPVVECLELVIGRVELVGYEE